MAAVRQSFRKCFNILCQSQHYKPTSVLVRCHSDDKKHEHSEIDRKRKTPIGKLDNEMEMDDTRQIEEKEPLEKFPDGVNPITGEIGGPRGPEPTRYGDWERKGRVSDF